MVQGTSGAGLEHQMLGGGFHEHEALRVGGAKEDCVEQGKRKPTPSSSSKSEYAVEERTQMHRRLHEEAAAKVSLVHDAEKFSRKIFAEELSHLSAKENWGVQQGKRKESREGGGGHIIVTNGRLGSHWVVLESKPLQARSSASKKCVKGLQNISSEEG